MRHLVLICAFVALALPATALGKGPSAATIDGPGISGGGITIRGCCANGTPAMNLADLAGFFPAVFAGEPDPMFDARPAGDLGPRYVITYTVPGPNNETWKIRQNVYPYATPTPVTYTKPGQPVFELPGGSHGGWFQADGRLEETLVAVGLPKRSASGGGDGRSTPGLIFPAVALVIVLAAAALLIHRRLRPAARMAGSPS